MKYKPNVILIDRLAEHLPVTQSILKKFKGVDFNVIEDISAVKRPSDFSAAKKTMLITMHTGDAFKPCQGIGPGHLCCNYWIIDLISNCPMDCSYCILQHYLANNPLLTIYANIDEILTKASIFVSSHRDKKFRIGTGELSDSLALDHITGFSKKIIEYFSCQPHVSLEFKTKTANIDHLLKADHRGRTVISWSINPRRIIEQEEIGTASLTERFEAAKKAVEAGYMIGFHFDPIIFTENWEVEYREVAEHIVKIFPHDKIAWISLGTLRFPQEIKDIVKSRFPKSNIFFNELVPVNGKVRYFRPIRENIYKKMALWLEPLAETTPIYLCMETKLVWEHTMPGRADSNRSVENHVCRLINPGSPEAEYQKIITSQI